MTKDILNGKIQCYLMYLSVFYFYKSNDLPFRKAILSWVLLPIPLTVITFLTRKAVQLQLNSSLSLCFNTVIDHLLSMYKVRIKFGQEYPEE